MIQYTYQTPSTMAAATKQKCTDGESRTAIYYEYLENTRSNKIKVYSTKLRGTDKNVAVLLMMDPSLSSNANAKTRKCIKKLAKSEWNCKYCRDRINRAAWYVGADGKSPVCNVLAGRTKLQTKMSTRCSSVIEEYIERTKGLHWNYQIVRNDTLYADCPSNTDEHGTVYRHYSWVPEHNSEALCEHKVKDGNTLVLLEKALNKYCPMMIALFDKIGASTALLASMETVKELLEKASYGKQQIPAVNWCIKHVQNIVKIRPNWRYLTWQQKVGIVITAICDCSLSIADEDSDDVLCGLYHTVNGNVLSLLEKGETPEAVVAMIEVRNDPRNYKQTTAPPKAIHIEKARNLFKGFVATIHTTDELEQLEGCATIGGSGIFGSSNDVDDAFNGMAATASKKKKANRYGGFASRMNASSQPNPTNMRELMEAIRSGQVKKLELIPTQSTVYTAKWEGENLRSSDFCVPHLWIFNSDTRWTQFSYQEITHVYRVKTCSRENYHFIIKNARNTLYGKSLVGNCTLKEFLATKHQKTAGNAFHALKNTTKVRYHDWKPLSLGVGTSVNKGTSLINTLTFKINGKRVNISRSGFN